MSQENLVNCPQCGAQVDSRYKFCLSCGSELRVGAPALYQQHPGGPGQQQIPPGAQQPMTPMPPMQPAPSSGGTQSKGMLVVVVIVALVALVGAVIPIIFTTDLFGSFGSESSEPPIPIMPNQQIQGTLTNDHTYRLYELGITQPSTVTISVNSSYDNYLELYAGESETPMAQDDDGGSGFNAQLTTTLQPNVYYILVRPFSSGTGPFTLTTSVVSLTPTPAPGGGSGSVPGGGGSGSVPGAGGSGSVPGGAVSNNFEVRGSLSQEVIRRYVQRHSNQVRYCYEQQLAQNPDLRGRVIIRFVISPSGAVTTSAVAGSTLGNPAAEQCVARAVQRIAFPQPEGGGVVIVNYPFAFEQGS